MPIIQPTVGVATFLVFIVGTSPTRGLRAFWCTQGSMASTELESIIGVWGVAPLGSRGKAPGRGWGDKVPWSWQHSQKLTLTFAFSCSISHYFPHMHAVVITRTLRVVTLCHVLSVLYIILILRKLSCLWNLSLLPWECINLLGSIELHSIIIRLVDRSFDYVRGGSKGGQGAAAPVKFLAPCGPQKVQDKAATCQYFLLKL